MKPTLRKFALMLIASVALIGQQRDLVANEADDVVKLENLLSEMSSATVEERQASQTEFEKICLGLTAPGREVERQSAARVISERLIKADNSTTDSAIATLFLLRQLERIGAKESVPVLSQLLESDDPHVQDGARRALRSNPDPTAGAALRAALDSTPNARLRVGIINALGERTDVECVPALAKHLISDDRETFRASANSLVRIATPSAENEIRLAYEKARGESRQFIADAWLRCVDRVAESGSKQAAQAMYAEIVNSVGDSPVRLAALRGQLMTADKLASELVLSILGADDKQAQQVAVDYIADMPVARIPSLLAGMDRLSGTGKSVLISAMGNRRATQAIETVRKYVDSDVPNLRKTALTAIGTIGDIDDAKQLVQVMQTGSEDRMIAANSLAEIRDDRVDAMLVDELANTHSEELRPELIGILNRRRATSAVAELLNQAISDNQEVRRRAVGALSRLASQTDLADLMKVHGATAREERDSIEKAIVSVCQRVPSPEGRADALIDQYDNADSATRVRIIQVLGRVGGRNAQRAIEGALESRDADLYDAAVMALANWPDGSVADQLLQLARDGRTESQRTRALRSLARVCVLPTSTRTDLQRLEFLKQAMELATRKEEIDLVIDRAKAVRMVETLRFVAPYLDKPDYRDRATTTVLDLAHHQNLREPNRTEFEPELQKIMQSTKDSKLLERAEKYLQNR